MGRVDLGHACSTPNAAVPSLHAGFAVAVGAAVAVAAPGPWPGRGVLWGALVVLAVLATGNHFVLDVLAGLVVAGAGLAVAVAGRPVAPAPGSRPAGGRRGVPQPPAARTSAPNWAADSPPSTRTRGSASREPAAIWDPGRVV